MTRSEDVAVDRLVARCSLKHDIVISALVYTVPSYQETDMSFIQNVRDEGIKI